MSMAQSGEARIHAKGSQLGGEDMPMVQSGETRTPAMCHHAHQSGGHQAR
jgi:hypothetical protein